MNRGDIVTIAAPGDYGKPRPAVIVQSDFFNDAHASILVCPFTTDLVDAPLFRIDVTPTDTNGLEHSSQIMADKLITMRREKIGVQIGRLDAETLLRLDRSLMLVLGLADRAAQS